ncbi:autolysin [Apilactobacillus micheneri]|uniref:Autolysin n=1 Tax=Apilactobacillus micheneri TaxID=1899430 RepID=A0ABY2Z0E1_9LACO|nr:GH25 family lysozyme [Apilactobacillus micheneri]TPR23121.1 autolysin [Apilactobacillus micheneri]TPR24439.1 autolysin [Apilactobacillus micheneri]TPR29386.1 autolysin [Apilactobacillus micheneri]TPR34593.1 autolysin [Apilactobacillus micheneri]
MGKFNIFNDVSSFQSSDIKYFKGLRSAGSKGAVVKVSEGNDYENLSCGQQMMNTFDVFKVFGCYHFFRGMPISESNFFIAMLRKHGVDKTTRLALDVECACLPKYTTNLVNTFLNRCYNAGFHNLSVYGSASWFNSGRIDKTKLVHHALVWVANYGVSQPDVTKADAWQYTDKFLGTDGSYEFNDNFVNPNLDDRTPEYWHIGKRFSVKTNAIKIYSDKNLRHWTGDTLAKSSIFDANPIKVGKIYRLNLANKFGFVTSNCDFTHRIAK